MSDNNYNSNEEINKENNVTKENTNTTQGASQYSWNGDSYHYTYKDPSAGGNGYYNNPPQPPVVDVPKKKRNGTKIALSIVVVIICCALVSGGTLAAFVGLLNNGKIALENKGTNSSPAYTITKLISSENEGTTGTNTSTNTGSELTESEIAKKILPSIVLIENYQITSSTNPQIGGFQLPGGDESSKGSDVSPASEGSGIIASADGYIITNAHVVEGATSLKVVTYDGNTYEAKLVGSDTATDLAVVKIDAQNLTAAEFGSSGDLNVGQEVLTAGNPGGSEFGFSITVGYISALNRTVANTETGYSMTCIQTDAAVNPGNSGGALVNKYGQVIGIVSSKIVSESFEGLGFAIPVDDAQKVISDLESYGYVKDRAVLGITGTYVDAVTARFYGLSAGWYVASVTNDSLTQAGLQKGDVITAIDGNAVTSTGSIGGYLLTKKPGDTVSLTVSRSLTKENLTMNATLTEFKNS